MPSLRITQRIVVLIALVELCLQLLLLLREEQFLVTLVTIDDTYYYIQTAWNHVRLGFPSFDGLDRTNGVQFLWYLATFAASTLAATKAQLVFLTVALCFLLNFTCYLIILKLSKALNSPAAGLLLAGLWSLQSFGERWYSTGMENSLHAFIFWCITLKLVEFFQNRSTPVRSLYALLPLLVMNGWTRIDSGVFSAVIALACVVGLPKQKRTKAFLISGCVGLIGLGLQLLFFKLMAGSWLSVSALVKSTIISPHDFSTLIKTALQYGSPAFMPMALVNSGWFWLLTVAIFGACAVVAYRTRTPLALSILTLIGAYFAYNLIIASSRIEYAAYFTWYRAPLQITWILALTFLINQFAKRSAAPLALVCFGFSFLMFHSRATLPPKSLDRQHHSLNYQAARWAANNLPDNAVLAAWNAGEIGYFSEHKVINLDGLINSVDYYERIFVEKKPLLPYLKEKKVQYIVDHDTRHIPATVPVIKEFPVAAEPAKRQIHIWKLF